MNRSTLTSISVLLLFSVFNFALVAQHSVVKDNAAGRMAGGGLPFDQRLAPFYHGVASGDPTTDAVIIWTRVTPETDQQIAVDWEVASDVDFATVVANGQVTTDSSRDYTVKVDVTGLSSGSTYFYRFAALSSNSIIGRTRTAPSGSVDQLKFVIASCNNYQSGYYNAFGRIAELNDIDAVIHLGDFIYEYGIGEYGNLSDRLPQPDQEILTLFDYRTRHSFYRLDADMRRAMQQHPFILTWDDHEVANDAWVDGAQNHDSTEGDFATRKQVAMKAYWEWAPVRDNANSTVMRTLGYGDLAKVIMLDTRHEARDEPVDSVTDPNYFDTTRTLIGDAQMQWFKTELSNSTAQWTIVGNQVIFADMNLAPFEPFRPGVSSDFIDTWDGFPHERLEVINHIGQNNIDNVVFVTGDAHISLAFDVPAAPLDTNDYNPETGSGSVAVEMLTPSISSNNIDEELGESNAFLFQTLFPTVNPHSKYVDLMQHGYMVLDLTASKAQTDWYYVATVLEPSSDQIYAGSTYTLTGDNHLTYDSTASSPKPQQETPAPDPTLTSVEPNEANMVVFSLYPNPVTHSGMLHYGLSRAGKVNITIIDMLGNEVQQLVNEDQRPGTYSLVYETKDMPVGQYILRLEVDGKSVTRKLVKL